MLTEKNQRKTFYKLNKTHAYACSLNRVLLYWMIMLLPETKAYLKKKKKWQARDTYFCLIGRGSSRELLLLTLIIPQNLKVIPYC